MVRPRGRPRRRVEEEETTPEVSEEEEEPEEPEEELEEEVEESEAGEEQENESSEEEEPRERERTLRVVTQKQAGKIVEFKGDDTEDVEEWLDQFEWIAELNNWSEDIKCVNLAGNLTGLAKDWFEILNIEQKKRYDYLKRKMLETFKHEDSVIRFRHELDSCKQIAGQSVQSYIYRKMKLCKRANRDMDESEKRGHLLQGLLPKFKAAVLKKKATTLKRMIDIIIAEERGSNIELETQERVKVNEDKGDVIIEKIRQIVEVNNESLIKKQFDKLEQLEERMRMIKEEDGKSSNKVKEANKGEEKVPRKREREERRCFNCGKVGHLIGDCWAKRRRTEDANKEDRKPRYDERRYNKPREDNRRKPRDFRNDRKYNDRNRR
jgi:hypothetical protein